MRKKLPTAHQKQVLRKIFEAKPYLEEKESDALAVMLHTDKKWIKTWFCNRRSERKREAQLHTGE